MARRQRATLDQLRQAIDQLPRESRAAMLRGIECNPIIVGAYASRDGICPMLAAHRQGGRTPLIAFAEAWDAYAFRSVRRVRSRRATERELLVLRSHLEASLLAEEGPLAAEGPLAGGGLDVVAAPSAERPGNTERPRTVTPAPARADPRPGEPDRRRELREAPGWAWTRVVRRLDDYERLVAATEEPSTSRSGSAGPPAPISAIGPGTSTSCPR